MASTFFFVISGFLITSIILPQISNGTYSSLDFYLRRGKRILPVLFIVLIATMLFGFIATGIPGDLREISSVGLSSALFSSNLYLPYKLGGYFDTISNQKPLLHTWSLSVEEQFYIFWPLALLFMKRHLREDYIFRGIIALFILSFPFSIYLSFSSSANATWGYFSLPTRAWELAIGAGLAFLPSVKDTSSRHFYAYLGVILIIGSICLISHSSPFPGPHAIWPCLGAALLVYAGSAPGLARTSIDRLLQSKVMTAVGRRSYGLYLWHWPILSYMRYLLDIETLPVTWIISSIIATIILSELSYRLIEQPLRKKSISFKDMFRYYYLAPLFIIVSIHTVTSLASRKPIIADALGLVSNQSTTPYSNQCSGEDTIGPRCHFSSAGDTKKDILVVGDSHAGHLTGFLNQLQPVLDKSIDIYFNNSCLTLLSTTVNNLTAPESAKSACLRQNEYFADHFKEYKTVILSHRWMGYDWSESREDQLRQTLTTLSKSNVHVIIFGDIPNYDNDQLRTALAYTRLGLPLKSTPDFIYKTRNAYLQRIAQSIPNVSYFDFDSILCANDHCSPIIDNKIIYSDRHHLSETGAEIIAKKMLQPKYLDVLKSLVSQ
ncbi:acyltransferase family protein [Jeongeupia sp. HS-3]|uniref:acyltransferase family protein n=1 Tax=Jeongeupia sp. HS-3 TaxID=1009682 RepID=UPI001910B718|nr:acyltransferase family protein [Jeongeupia sp. HS-3]